MQKFLVATFIRWPWRIFSKLRLVVFFTNRNISGHRSN